MKLLVAADRKIDDEAAKATEETRERVKIRSVLTGWIKRGARPCAAAASWRSAFFVLR